MNILSLLPIIYNNVQTLYGCCLPYTLFVDLLCMLHVIYNNVSFHVDPKSHVYFCVVCLLVVITIVWQKIFPIIEIIIKMEMYRKKKELMYEHKKTLCNTNMNYFFLFICKVKPNTNKKTMKNSSTISHYNNESTTYFPTLFLFL
jgi:hypothetical protein